MELGVSHLKNKIARFGKFVISSLLFYSGGVLVFNKIKCLLGFAEIKILAYHNVSKSFPGYLGLSQTPELFEAQIKYLKQNYDIISLSEAIQLIKMGTRLNKDKVVITFDDNYREYYTEVLPLKEKYNFHMTLFVAVDPLEHQEPLFVDGLVYAINSTNRKTIDLTPFGMKKFFFLTRMEKLQAVDEINECAKSFSRKKRSDLLNFLCRQLDDIDIESLRELCLTWDQLKQMKENGVSIGAHTLSHPVLTDVPPNEAKYEIVQSKKKLEDRLNCQIETFAYPYGNVESYDENVRRYVKEAGYLAACTLHGSGKQKDLYALNRINMDTSMSTLRGNKFFKPLFAMELSGLGDLLFFRWVRKSLPYHGTGKMHKYLKAEKATNKRKTKILFVIDQLIKFAGTEKHLYQVTTNLDKERFSCHVIAFNASPLMVQKFRGEGIAVESLNLDKIYGWLALKKFFYLISRIRSIKPDIIQTFHFMSDTFAVCAARLAGVPIIVSNRRDMGDLKRKRQILLNRLVNHFVNHFVSVCDRVGHQLSKVEKVSQRKISTIYNGVDLKRYEVGHEAKHKARDKLGIKQDAFAVGNACILRPEKDVLLFLKAMSSLDGQVRNLSILVVGDGITRKDLESYARKNGLFDRTIFSGYVNDIRDWVQAMDVVCLTPKENEGLSNVILEEMAMGKPVIATDVGGNGELVVDGVTGFVITPGDRDSLARCIMTLYENPGLRESMGKAGRRRVEQHFTLEKMIQNIESFYDKLLRSKGLNLQ